MENWSENPDLAWDIDFIHQQRAMDFLLQFEETLCVYSPSVRQIYSSYNIYFPKDWGSKAVILPDPNAFHDTFSFIERDAIVATGLHIIPGDMIQREGLFLANVNADRTLGNKQVPFVAGIQAVLSNRPQDDPFLPILAKGDLREFEQNWPVLHLHRVRLSSLSSLSEMDRRSIGGAIREKLDGLLREQALVG